MKKLFTIFTVLTLSLIFVSPARAVTPTSPAPTAASGDMVDQVKTMVQENLATTEAKLKEKLDLQSLVGFVGKVTTINSGNLTIDSRNNLLQATTSAKTAFIKNGLAIKIASLAIDDKIIIIGTSIKNDIVQAKRITVIKDEPVLVKTTAVVAKTVSIDLKKKTITLTIGSENQVLTLSKKSTVKLEELEADQTILAIIKEYNGALSISRAKVL